MFQSLRLLSISVVCTSEFQKIAPSVFFQNGYIDFTPHQQHMRVSKHTWCFQTIRFLQIGLVCIIFVGCPVVETCGSGSERIHLRQHQREVF